MLKIHDEKIPLRTDPSGLVYVGDTRVTLNCIAEMFDEGASPEEIVEQYDALQLADVYAVITYLLRNQTEVATYLAHDVGSSEESRQALDAKFPPTLRAKLLKAHQKRESRGG